ncbi:hypothetical protein ACFVSS_17475 [Peribacillus butanolivorans]|uniref:hypothetical protein n=1 Tax=Peribacillus butanolivorans TaxID=421767 RepID=UPI0036D7E397
MLYLLRRIKTEATKEGKQYVGSASGKEGLLGRWKEYAINGHGNNTKLKELIEADP